MPRETPSYPIGKKNKIVYYETLLVIARSYMKLPTSGVQF